MKDLKKKTDTAKNVARFHFYGDLNDFLPRKRRRVWFKHPFKGNPAIKDSIESLGVPHVEVLGILVHGKSVGFSYQLRHKDKVAVYPNDKKIENLAIKRLQVKSFRHPRFILDAHLGKLARHLRLFGFDTFYKKDYSDRDIVGVVRDKRRIVLTRDIGLLKNKAIRHGYWIRTTDPEKQIREVVRRFDLGKKIRPFKICLECNGRIIRVKKSKVIRRLPPLTKDFFQKFHLCVQCKRIYWQGSHYDKLKSFIARIEKEA